MSSLEVCETSARRRHGPAALSCVPLQRTAIPRRGGFSRAATLRQETARLSSGDPAGSRAQPSVCSSAPGAPTDQAIWDLNTGSGASRTRAHPVPARMPCSVNSTHARRAAGNRLLGQLEAHVTSPSRARSARLSVIRRAVRMADSSDSRSSAPRYCTSLMKKVGVPATPAASALATS